MRLWIRSLGVCHRTSISSSAPYFITSALPFAVLLFRHIEPLGVAWLRIATAAVIFAKWQRPWRLWATTDRPTKKLILGLGTTLALMNSLFYLAIDRLPLATVASIEFVGVIVVALIGVRTLRNVAAPWCGGRRSFPSYGLSFG